MRPAACSAFRLHGGTWAAACARLRGDVLAAAEKLRGNIDAAEYKHVLALALVKGNSRLGHGRLDQEGERARQDAGRGAEDARTEMAWPLTPTAYKIWCCAERAFGRQEIGPARTDRAQAVAREQGKRP